MHPPPPTAEDAELDALVRRWERPLGAFLAQMTSSRALAEDLLQETFLTVWRERDRLPADPGEQRAWLYGIARNRALAALRRRRRGREALARLAHRVGVDGGREDSRVADALAMRDLLVRTLRPQDRSLFVLRHVHGFDASTLARLTGLTPEAVRKRLQRAGERMLAAHACTDHPTKTEDAHARAHA
jgi:RNA polymerase sigma factor (sigma-70 family)